MMLWDHKLQPWGQILIFILLSLLALSYLLNLGVQPIYLEEPKRALVSLEMYLNNNFFVPTEFGQPYYNKPPLYNWILSGIYGLTGNLSEWYVRIVSVISFLTLGIIHFLFTRRNCGKQFALISSLLLLVSVDIYYYFSLTGEIDLFYSLIIYAMTVSIYHFREQQQYYSLFILAYFLAALGMLTKSIPTIVFLGISLLVTFWLKKDLKKLFSLAHLTGILLFSAIIGFYIVLYAQMHDPSALLSGLWTDSSKRTIINGMGAELFRQMFRFPLETLKNLLPASILIIFAFRKDLLAVLKSNPFILFSLLIFLANYLLYFISPEAKQRYIYALYPFLVNVLLFLFLEFRKDWKMKYLKTFAWAVLGLGIAGSIAILYIPDFYELTFIFPVSLFSFLALALLALYWCRMKLHPLLVMVVVLIIFRIIFDMTILPVRAHDDHASVRKNDGLEIARIAGNKNVYLLGHSNISNGMVYYIVNATAKVVRRENDPTLPGYFIVDKTYLDTPNVEIVYNGNFRGRKFGLVKFDPVSLKAENLQITDDMASARMEKR